MNLKLLLPAAFIFPIVGLAVTVNNREASDLMSKERIESIPDSLFEDVTKEHLLNDEVYLKLAKEGWSANEIRNIMTPFVAENKAKLRGSYGYNKYQKQWLPTYRQVNQCDTLYEYVDTNYSEELRRAVRRASAEQVDDPFNNYTASPDYSPTPRLNGEAPQPGLFRRVLHKPSSGRILWIQVHPTDSNKIMVIPDGCGICRTDDGGKTWDMITERIPNRFHRNIAYHSAIPVDPDDWNHLFAFMKYGSNVRVVYETFDGGQTWEQVEGATHWDFKRGYAFRDKEGTLRFIGSTQSTANSYWSCPLRISEDKGVTWTQVTIPDELKDVHPVSSYKGAWFQEVAFDPTNRDLIYLPTSQSIFYFDDGARPTEVDGNKTYNIKKMEFNVWNGDSTELRSSGYNFPFPGNTQAFLNINPNNPLEMWFATSARNNSAVGDYSAIYRSRDGGKNWITLCEPYSGIGSGRIYGNETTWGWLGGFGVNYIDQSKVYGCSMSSGYSEDGGVTCKEYGWGNRMTSEQDDGNYYYVSNSRHNADNHCIVSHKSGRVFRGSDGGMLMIDPNVNGGKWTNIGNNMGQMLYYCIKVNEFGDQVMLGNTQDIDVQTYRDGRWGNWRGYEGSAGMINPYSNMCYYSGGGGGLEGVSIGSWNPSTSYADVCTGNWYCYMNDAKQLYVIKDIGRTAIAVPTSTAITAVHGIGLSRTGEEEGQSTLWVRFNNRFLYTHDDFETYVEPTGSNKYATVYSFAADPNNWQQLYITYYDGKQSYVKLINMITNEVIQDLTYDLPASMACSKLYLHEGSGDLYFYNSGVGIYELSDGETSWKFWTKGYNAAKSTDIVINYATQEMVLCDYGRGVYCADLEHPSDRYFSDGFELKELSHIDGKRTIGINTKWTIPLYYNYKWTVNGTDVNNPYQYLTKDLKAGDVVKLELTLRENPRVKTTSKEFTVAATDEVVREHKSGKALYSNGNGRVDLGNVDLFLNDFTVEFWINPETNTGVILANGERTQTRDGRGWWLGLTSGTIQFNYAPAHRFYQPTYESTITQEATLSAGTISTDKWSHIALTQKRNGTICIYVNGKKMVESERILPNYPLNNSVNLSLFADGYEESTLAATVDELKIWNYALEEEDVRRVMLSHNSSDNAGLVYYNGFNGETLSEDVEQYSQWAPISRIKAETTALNADVPVDADYVANADLSAATSFADGEQQLLKIAPQSGSTTAVNVSVFGYTENLLASNSANLAADRYNVEGLGYSVVAFGDYDADDKATITFPLVKENSAKTYQVLCAPINQTVAYWKKLGYTTTDENGYEQLTDVTMSDIIGNRFVVVSIAEGIEIDADNTNMADDGYISLYDQYTYIPFEAHLYGDKTISNDGYKVVSSNENVVVEDGLYFINGKAEGKLRVSEKIASEFNESVEITLKGEDDLMIPYTLRVKNKVVPSAIGDGLTFVNSGLYVGTTDQFEAMNDCNTMTLMTWVRFDNNSFMTGTRGIIMFRNESTDASLNKHATGLHIEKGNVRCHWNEESWSWGTSTGLSLTEADTCRWVHLAMVARPDGLDFYLDGKRYTVNKALNKAQICARLMLAQTNFGQTWFSGAFDQTMVWNRSLSQEEVLTYMQTGPKLDDKSLVAYMNMDYLDENDMPRELIKGSAITTSGGTIEAHKHTDIPYNPSSVGNYSATNPPTDADLQITIDGATPTYRLANFKNYSYNFASDEETEYRPISKESFTVVWPETPTTSSTSTVLFTYVNSNIAKGEDMELALRPLGTTTPYTDNIQANATEDGKVVFTVPVERISRAVEAMILTTAASSPNKVKLALRDDETRSANKFILKEGETQIPVNVKLISGTDETAVTVYIAETDIASADKDSIVPTDENASFTINIDRDKLLKKEWNHISARLLGIDAEPLELEVAFEPKVRLYTDLENDKFLATTAISTIPVKAELLQGVLDENVKLEIVADVPSVINRATGSLLTNITTEVPTLNYYNADNALNDGWNLVANPFLTTINLSKHQNYESEGTGRFIYSFDNKRRNFIVTDVTNYESDKLIQPFSAFFVQAEDNYATFAVTPESKSKKISRKVYDYNTAELLNAVTLELYNGDDVVDETKVIWDDGYSTAVVLDEDAEKMASIDTDAESIYTLAGTDAMAINSLPLQTITTPLVVTTTSSGTKTIKVKSLTFGVEDCYVALYDKVTDKETRLEEDTEYSFNVTSASTIADRFEIRLYDNRVTTGANTIENSGYSVTVDGNICTVSGLKGNADVAIYDVAGREIVKDHTINDSYRTELSTGYYVVEIKENNQTVTTKIVIK